MAQAIAIDKHGVNEILNSKGEWGFPRIPCLMVQVGDQPQEEKVVIPTWSKKRRAKRARAEPEESGIGTKRACLSIQ